MNAWWRVCEARDGTVRNDMGNGSGRLWPVQFWPIHVWPSCLASHFWPIHFFVLCCGWFWCGLVFCVVCVCCCVLCVAVCCSVLCCCCCCLFLLLWLWSCWWCGCWFGPPAGPPSAGPPKISRFSFPLPPPVFILSLPLLLVLLVEFLWCFWRPGPSNVHVWALGLSCETPAASSC